MKRGLSEKNALALMKLRIRLSIAARKILYPVIYRRSLPQYNIYHCCIQKTATQWFSKLLNDRLIWRNSGFSLYYPGENFITRDEKISQKLHDIPKSGIICSPLYIQYNDFLEFTSTQKYRAFYIIRDPRDIVISNYFSIKFSHPNTHDFIDKNRKELTLLSEHDGIAKIINDTAGFYAKIMHDWKKSTNDNIKVYKFEDVFGPDQHEYLKDIFIHCRLSIPPPAIQYLVDQYSFKKISGRKPGTEDKQHHYRKGVSGDWKNYFSAEHKKIFNKKAGDLLLGLGYEKDLNW